MKILKISALKLQFETPEEERDFISKKLLKSKFDLNKPVEKYKGLNNFNHLFLQEFNESNENT